MLEVEKTLISNIIFWLWKRNILKFKTHNGEWISIHEMYIWSINLQLFYSKHLPSLSLMGTNTIITIFHTSTNTLKFYDLIKNVENINFLSQYSSAQFCNI